MNGPSGTLPLATVSSSVPNMETLVTITPATSAPVLGSIAAHGHLVLYGVFHLAFRYASTARSCDADSAVV